MTKKKSTTPTCKYTIGTGKPFSRTQYTVGTGKPSSTTQDITEISRFIHNHDKTKKIRKKPPRKYKRYDSIRRLMLGRVTTYYREGRLRQYEELPRLAYVAANGIMEYTGDIEDFVDIPIMSLNDISVGAVQIYRWRGVNEE